MPIVPAPQVRIYNPAEGEEQALTNFTVPTLLPDLGEVLEVAGGVPAAQFAAGARWALAAANNWQLGAQLTLGHVVSTVGIPAFEVFDVVMEALGQDVSELFDDALRQSGETLNQALSRLEKSDEGKVVSAAKKGLAAGVGPAVDAAAVVPVLGWSVQIAWSLAMLVRRVAQLLKDQNQQQQQLYEESSFSAEGDHLVFEGYLQRLQQTRDWTLIFQAPGWGKPKSWMEPFGRHVLGDDGKQFGLRFLTTNPINGAMGNVPGTGWCHQSLEVLDGKPVEPGAFLPSTRGQAGWLWEHVIKTNGPALYTIDTGKLIDNWSTYLHDLRVYLSEFGLSDSELKKILLFWNGANDAKGNYRKIFGWVSKGKPKLAPTDDEWEKYQPVREASDLAERQRALLDTLLVAYIDDSFAALKADPSLKALWLERRQQLLSHPARCKVDITNVPDADYREALKDSGHGTGFCLASGILLTAEGFDGPDKKLPQGQTGFPIADGSTLGKKRRRRGSSGLVPVVALGAGAVLAHKKGWLRSKRLRKLWELLPPTLLP